MPIVKDPYNLIKPFQERMIEEEKKVKKEHPELNSEEIHKIVLENLCE